MATLSLNTGGERSTIIAMSLVTLQGGFLACMCVCACVRVCVCVCVMKDVRKGSLKQSVG